ncbi:hypothetical protein [Nocardia sp. NPDC060249]|uniref:hypothetical protein n=1 Tax=Nocardia sp. NPDC060249 TaxID=3347082 RepID=UPI00365F08B0
MSTPGEYRAGSAYLTLNPKLANQFRAMVKTLVKPINESLTVTLKPKLAAGFRAEVKDLAKSAAEGAGAKIEFGHKLAPKFRTTLKAAAKLEGEKAGANIYFTPELKAGFKTLLRGKVNAAAAGVEATVTLKLSEAGLRQKIRGLKATLPAAQLTVKLDLTEAVQQLAEFRTAVSAQPLSMNVNVDTSAAVAQLMALRTLASDVGDRVNSISGASIGRSARRLTGNIITRPIRAIRLQVELDRDSVSRAEAELANVIARLQVARRQQGDTLDNLTLAQHRHDEVMANGNSTLSQRTAATTRLTRAQRDHADATGRLSSLMGQEADANDRLDRSRSRQGSLMSSLSAAWSGFRSAATDAITSAAKNLFSFSNLAGLAKVALIGLAAVSLVPLIGQLAQAAGVIALLPAAVTGLGAVLATIVTGFSGIGDAFAAAKKVSDGAAKQAESQAKAVASAQKSAESAARGVASAQRGVVSAEKGVRSAQKESLAAQKALTTARKDARKELEDLNRELKRTKLDEQGAALSVAEAQEDLNEVFRDTSSTATERARAQYNLDKALQDQEDTLRSSRELAEKTNEANEKGVEGSDAVVAAKDRVASAAEAEADAQQSLVDAHQSLADAQEQLVEAQQAVTKAMNDSGDAAEEFERKLAKLSPAAQDFVKKWLAVKPQLSGLADGVQENLFDKMGDSVSSLVTKWIPTLKDGLGGIATEINGGLRRAFADFESEATRSKLDHIFGKVADSIGPVIDGLNDMVQGFLSLAQVGSDFMPSGAQSFADLMARFREWAESPEGQTKFKEFLDKSLDAFGRIKDLVKEIGRLLGAVFSGSEETGETMLDDIIAKLKEWADWAKSPEGQQAIKDFFKDVKDTADAVVHAIEKIISLMNDVKSSAPAKVLGSIFNDKKAATDADGNPILDADGKPVEVDKTTQERVGDYLGGLAGGVKYNIPVSLSLDFIKSGWGKVKEEWDDIADDFGPALDDFKSDIGGLRDSVVGWFGDIGTAALDNLQTSATGALSTLGNAVPGLKDKLAELSKDGSLSFADMGRAALSSIADITGINGFIKLTTDSTSLTDFFGDLMTDIGAKWAELPGKLSGPINTLIDNLNNLGEIWNKVASKLGLPTWEPMSHVGTSSTTDPFAGRPTRPEAGGHVGGRWMGGPGGPVKGPGGPTEDKAGLYRLSNGEHVWTAAEVAAAGGHEAMYNMRAAALDGGGTQSKPERDGAPGYADGGVVSTSDPLDPVQAQLWDLVRSAIPDAVLTSGKRFADVGSGFDYHMQGKAIDLAGPMDKIARWIYETYPQSSELIHWPLAGWQNLKNGAPLDYGASTNADHMDHVHWANADFLGNLSDEEKASIFSRIGSALSGAVNSGKNALANTLLLNPLRAAANNVPELSGFGDAGKIPKAFAKKLVESLASRVLGSGSSGGGGAAWEPSAGAEQWRQMIIDAYKKQGYEPTPEKVDAWVRQIDTESGGDPNVAQQIVDVNGTGESAGVGLGQMIPTTWQSYRDPSLPDNRRDPWAMTNAMVRYGEQKYGARLLDVIGQGHGYDQGGIFPSGTFGWNASGLPEAVLTNPQWKMFQQFVGGMTNQAPQTLEAPGVSTDIVPGTDGTGTGTDFTSPSTSGSSSSSTSLDTWETLGTKAQERFGGALSSFVDGQIEDGLSVVGAPDPRDIPLYSAAKDYYDTYSSWANSKAAGTDSTSTLASSGYYQAGQSAAGAANTVTNTDTGGNSMSSVTNDNTTNIYIQTADTAEAFRKAQQIQELRSLTSSARGS